MMKGVPEKERQKLMQQYSVYEEKFDNRGNPIATTLNLPNLGELIFNELNLHFLTTYDNKEIFVYENGYYISRGEPIIQECVELFLGDDSKEHYKKETVGYIRDKNYRERTLFDSEKYLINLENGVYDVKHNKFLEHDPKYYFLSQLPITYDKKAKIKKIKNFLKQVLKSDDIARLQEIFGYCFYRDYYIQKAFMFLGEGANGKSTVLNLLKKMLGNQNVSSLSLQELCENRFAPANLYTKLANLYPDLPDKTLTRTGLFKILTGSDTISAEQKFRDHFNFVNYAKLIFSANKLPESKDDTNAYFRRWEFMTFPYSFYGKNCDTKIFDKISTETEMSGLFNWSLTGLRRLLKNGCFTNSANVDEMREKYQRLSSPIAAFVMDCIEIQPECYVKKDDLYACFVQYCVEKGLPAVAKNTFSMKLHEHVKVNDYRPTVSGKRVQAWGGIGFAATSALSDMSGYFTYLNRTDTSDSEIKYTKRVDNPDSLDQQEALDV